MESESYTFENANAVGIGVFDNDTDNLVQFRGIVSESAALTVTLNATDNTIVFDFDDTLLVADIPDATPTQRGIGETATNAEALAKAATDKFVTPSNFAAMGSTTTFAGFVELATSAETIAGVSTTLAVTPAGLLAASSLYSTVTWADAVTRAGATPSFAGQFGVQLDTDIPWFSRSAVAGGFDAPIIVGRGTNTLAAATTIAHAGFNITHSGAGAVIFDQAGGTAFTTGNTQILGNMQFGNGSGETINFEGPVLQVNGGTITDSLLGTDNTGVAVDYALSSFLSAYNQATGWGTPSGTLARTTFASYAGQTVSNPPTQAEVQAIDDALVIVSRRLAALITDLLARDLPSP